MTPATSRWSVLLDELRHALFFVLAGCLVAVGNRVGEWTIPKPETRVLVCLADKTGTVEVCKRLDELKNPKDNHGNR